MRPRPTPLIPYLLAFVLGVGAAGVAACGGRTNEAMIPASNAAELKEDLDDVLAAIESEDCDEAERAIEQVRSDLLELPSGTSQRLQQRLEEGVAALEKQAEAECQPKTTTETTATTTTFVPTETTPPPPPPPTTTETTPVPPPETTPPETTPPETVPPEDTGGVITP